MTGCGVHHCSVIAGLVAAIPIRLARQHSDDRDHRVTAVRAGAVMTNEWQQEHTRLNP
jgi:hypothetical protein